MTASKVETANKQSNERKRFTMKIRLASILGIALAGSVIGVWAADETTKDQPSDKPPMEKKAAMTEQVYVCTHCDTLAFKAGKCKKCGMDLQQKHLLGTKDGQAILCACPSGCKCDAKGAKEGKCACGTDVAKVSCKGLYACPNGCPEISKKPRKCACGKEMTKVE